MTSHYFDQTALDNMSTAVRGSETPPIPPRLLRHTLRLVRDAKMLAWIRRVEEEERLGVRSSRTRIPPLEIGEVAVRVWVHVFDDYDGMACVPLNARARPGAIPVREESVGFGDPDWESAAVCALIGVLKEQGRDREMVRRALDRGLRALDILWDVGRRTESEAG
jgi:hypothetical protein